MTPARMHPDEARRLDALHRLAVLDTESEERFDRLVELAATVIGAPIALISLVDRDRQWFKARVGVDARETPRDISFCAHAIVSTEPGPFVIADADADARFADNPLVAGEPHVRFYVGQVIHDPTGMPVGTLCALDQRPRQLDDAERRALAHLGHLVEQELARRTELELLLELEATQRENAVILETLTEGLVLHDATGSILRWNAAAERVLGLSGDELAGRTSLDPRWLATHADGTPWPGETHPAMIALQTGRSVHDAIMGVHHPGGQRVWVRVNAHPVIGADGTPTRVLAAFADVTAERDAQQTSMEVSEALRASEQTARASLDALEQGVILAGVGGTIFRINPAAERILGYSAVELTALWTSGRWATYDEDGNPLAPQDRPIARAVMTRRPVIGATVGWERADGERVIVRLSCIPATDGEDRLVIAFSDVTAERYAQRLLDATLETAPVGLAVLDHRRRILRCNPAFAEQAGQTSTDLVGTDVIDLVSPQDRADAVLLGQQLLGRTTSAGRTEHRVVRPDGMERWVSTHVAAIADPNQPFAIAATFDVTEQRRMVQELTRFSFLFQHANDIIVVVDPTGQVLDASPSSRLLMGQAPDRRPGGNILAITHPDDVAGVVRSLAHLTDGSSADHHGVTTFGTRARTAAGEWRHLECVAVDLLDEPAVRGIVITARDTTERERLTEQLAHRAEHDTLTDLPNRRKLQSRLDEALLQGLDHHHRVGVCFIDLDGFKAVNDRAGHAAGDALLVRVADAIRGAIRPTDTAARVGGDEFVVVLRPVDNSNEALTIATRVRDAITRLNNTSDLPMLFGASVGVAISQRSDAAPTLLARADAALYRAKARHDSSIEFAINGEDLGRGPAGRLPA